MMISARNKIKDWFFLCSLICFTTTLWISGCAPETKSDEEKSESSSLSWYYIDLSNAGDRDIILDSLESVFFANPDKCYFYFSNGQNPVIGRDSLSVIRVLERVAVSNPDIPNARYDLGRILQDQSLKKKMEDFQEVNFNFILSDNLFKLSSHIIVDSLIHLYEKDVDVHVNIYSDQLEPIVYE